MLAKGYAATSVNEICDHAEVSKGSFYHFFKTKQDCALEVIRHHVAEADEAIARGLDLDGLDPADAAIRYVEQIREISRDLFRDGCLIGTFALEVAETHPELRRRVSEIFRETTAKDEEMLKPLADLQSDPHAPSAGELAELMLMIIEGGVVLSKAHGDPRFVSQGLNCFVHYLKMFSGKEATTAQ
jgi:TetR/AcrR family transcriptional repressor of nem operon